MAIASPSTQSECQGRCELRQRDSARNNGDVTSCADFAESTGSFEGASLAHQTVIFYKFRAYFIEQFVCH